MLFGDDVLSKIGCSHDWRSLLSGSTPKKFLTPELHLLQICVKKSKVPYELFVKSFPDGGCDRHACRHEGALIRRDADSTKTIYLQQDKWRDLYAVLFGWVFPTRSGPFRFTWPFNKFAWPSGMRNAFLQGAPGNWLGNYESVYQGYSKGLDSLVVQR